MWTQAEPFFLILKLGKVGFVWMVLQNLFFHFFLTVPSTRTHTERIKYTTLKINIWPLRFPLGVELQKV